VLRLGLDEIFLVQGADDVVEAADHLSWEEVELKIEFLIEFLYMPSVHFEDLLLHQLKIIQLASVYLLAHYLPIH
jgi:hypothetical protein